MVTLNLSVPKLEILSLFNDKSPWSFSKLYAIPENLAGCPKLFNVF